MQTRPESYRRIAVIFGTAFIAVLLILMLVGHYGMPQATLGMLLGGTIMLTITTVGLAAGTLQPAEFNAGGRSLSSAANGMVSATGVMGSGLYIGLAGLNLTDIWTAAAVVVGWSLGLLALSAGIAPFIRRAKATGIADFLGSLYASRLVRISACLIIIAALMPLLVATYSAATFTASRLFFLSEENARLLIIGLVLASTLLGGMRALTRTAVLQYIVMAIAFLLPVTFVAVREYGMPVPHLAAGFAFDEALLHMEASGKALAASLGGSLLPATSEQTFSVMFVTACGVAVLPHLTIRLAMTATSDAARRVPGFTLLFILLLALAAPAYAAFAQLSLMRDVAGMPLETLPAWVHEFGAARLVQVCGISAENAAAVLGACRALPGFTGNLGPADIAIDADILLLAAPAILNLPPVFSALAALGVLAALVAAASAITFTIASTIGKDLSPSTPQRKRISAGRELMVMRLLILAVAALATWWSACENDHAAALSLLAFSLSGSALFPPVVMGIWWHRTTKMGALAGMVTGTAVTLFIALGHMWPSALPAFIPNPGRFGFDALTAAVFGIPAAFAATIAVSLFTSPSLRNASGLMGVIRRSGNKPPVDESES